MVKLQDILVATATDVNTYIRNNIESIAMETDDNKFFKLNTAIKKFMEANKITSKESIKDNVEVLQNVVPFLEEVTEIVGY